MIKHLVGVFDGKNIYAYTLYGHMKEVWVSEKDSQGYPTKITKGQPLGLMGSTGQSTGPHVHFEILFDPLDFFAITTELSKIESEKAQAAMFERWQKEEAFWLHEHRYN